MADDRPRPLLTKEQHQDHFNRVIAPMVLGAAEAKNAPVAVLLHGPPGIGKSTYADTRSEQVVGGGKVRPLHPQFEELRSGDERQQKELDKAVDDDTREWTAMLVDHARDNGLDVAIDSNLAGEKRLGDFVDQLHQPQDQPGRQPHRIEVHGVAGPRAASELRALDRFFDESVASGEKAPYCMQEIQDKNFDATLESARAVDESTEIAHAEVRSWWDQSEVLHTQDSVDGQWPEGPGFANAVEQARSAEYTGEQQQWHLQTAEKLAVGLGEQFHGESYLPELHRACTDAREVFPQQGAARDRLEAVIAASNPESTPQARGALRDSIKARALTETNNTGRPGAAGAQTAAQQTRPTTVQTQNNKPAPVRGV